MRADLGAPRDQRVHALRVEGLGQLGAAQLLLGLRQRALELLEAPRLALADLADALALRRIEPEPVEIAPRTTASVALPAASGATAPRTGDPSIKNAAATAAAAPKPKVPNNHQRIVRAIEGELAAKRLARVGRDAQPDLLVAYRVGFERSVRVTSTAYRFASPATTRVRPTLEGALLIELYDAHTGAVVWRGYAVREIDIDADPAQRERNIARTVRKVLKSYPPKR